MARKITHFAVKRYADGEVKTACGIKVSPKNATGTDAYVTCKRCRKVGY